MVAEASFFEPVAAASSLWMFFSSKLSVSKAKQANKTLRDPKETKTERTVPHESTNTESPSFLFLTKWSRTASAAGDLQMLPRQTISTRV